MAKIKSNCEPLDCINVVRYCVYDELPKKAHIGDVAITSSGLRSYLYIGDEWVKIGTIDDSDATDTVGDVEGTNCPNCGAVIDRSLDKCPYCETPYTRSKTRGARATYGNH